MLTKRKATVLLTGFGSFPGVAENATARLVPQIADAARLSFPEHEFVCEVLPTEWEAGPLLLAKLRDELRPVLALHFGVSERTQGFQIEGTARNVRSLIADACGALPDGGCVVDGAPEALASTFPAGSIVDGLNAVGLSAVLSDDAGSYLCNAVLYQSLIACGREDDHPMSAGFVHVPARLGEAGCTLSWDDAVRGGVAIVAACLQRISTRA